MNIGKFLLDTVKARILSLENEISLISKQLSVLSISPGIDIKNHYQSILEKNLKLSLHNAFLQYYNSMKELNFSGYQLIQVVTSHLYVMNLTSLKSIEQEIYGHKLAINSFLNAKSKNNNNSQKRSNQDQTLEDSVHFVLTIFPYEISVCLLNSSSFVTFLLKTVLNYQPQHHRKAVLSVMKKVNDFFKIHPISNKSIYFKYQDSLPYLIAEHFVCLFINRPHKNSLRDYSTSENCAIIAYNGLKICQLNSNLIQKIHNLSASISPAQSDDTDEGIYLSLSSNADNSNSDTSNFSYSSTSSTIPLPASDFYFNDDNEANETIISEFLYAIYEIRKISLQPSPSEMLHVLSKSIDYIQNLISLADGRMVGADETFPFLVYSISTSKLSRLPSIIDYIQKYSDSSLKATKFQYYIQHLSSSLSFIDSQELEISPYFIFPFSKPPRGLEKVLVRAEGFGSVTLKGFSVYAFPLWHPNITVPSLFFYSGGGERAVGYLYKIESEKFFDSFKKVKIIQSRKGAIMQLPDEFIDRNFLIRIDGGDFEASLEDFEEVSSLIVMCEKMAFSDPEMKRPSTAMKRFIFEKYVMDLWEFGNELAVKTAIAEVQMALVVLEKLPSSFAVDGVLNSVTIEGIKSALNLNDSKAKNNFGLNDLIHPKVFSRIISEMKKNFSS